MDAKKVFGKKGSLGVEGGQSRVDYVWVTEEGREKREHSQHNFGRM